MTDLLKQQGSDRPRMMTVGLSEVRVKVLRTNGSGQAGRMVPRGRGIAE